MQKYTKRACKKGIKLKKRNRTTQEWWNEEMEESRKRTRIKRREYQIERKEEQREEKKVHPVTKRTKKENKVKTGRKGRFSE